MNNITPSEIAQLELALDKRIEWLRDAVNYSSGGATDAPTLRSRNEYTRLMKLNQENLDTCLTAKAKLEAS